MYKFCVLVTLPCVYMCIYLILITFHYILVHRALDSWFSVEKIWVFVQTISIVADEVKCLTNSEGSSNIYVIELSN
jgi:hypothetical protein